MKTQFMCLAIAAWTAATPVLATIAMSIDVLDGVDPGAPSPPGRVIVDVGVDLSPDDWFFSAGIFGRASNGATLIYNMDPNSGMALFNPPREDDHFACFGSAAYGRNDPPRFAPAGTVAEQNISLAGRYIGGPVATLRPDEINVGYWAFPLVHFSNDPDAPRGRDGFVMRLAFDVSAVTIPGADDPANYRIFAPGENPPGYVPIFRSDGAGSTPVGTAVGSWITGGLVGQNWGLYVPEPSPAVGMLLFVPLLFSASRR